MTSSTERPGEEQLSKFKELARELEADEDEQRWDERLKRVAGAKLPPEDQKSE
jgi:hypothetical protein